MTNPPSIRVPIRRQVPFGFIILGLVLAGIFVNQTARLIFNPDAIGRVSLLIWAATFPLLICGSYRCLKRRYFYITATQAGFDSPKKDECPCDFNRVRDYYEDHDHISITHDTISVPLGIELQRHQFSTKDWETIRTALSERIQLQSPSTRPIIESNEAQRNSFVFRCRRPPRLADFLTGSIIVTIGISQITMSIDRETAWLIFVILTWPFIVWSQIKLIRKRLRVDLIIGLKSITFEDSQSGADRTSLSAIRCAEVNPYFIKINHDGGILPFRRKLLLSHAFFSPEDWSQIHELVLSRLETAGVPIITRH